jgi:hypothetical protein
MPGEDVMGGPAADSGRTLAIPGFVMLNSFQHPWPGLSICAA